MAYSLQTSNLSAIIPKEKEFSYILLDWCFIVLLVNIIVMSEKKGVKIVDIASFLSDMRQDMQVTHKFLAQMIAQGNTCS